MSFNVQRWAHNLQIEGVQYIDHGHAELLNNLNKEYKVSNIKSMGLYLGVDIRTVDPIYTQFVFCMERSAFNHKKDLEFVLIHMERS
jgi:hypothetical protein